MVVGFHKNITVCVVFVVEWVVDVVYDLVYAKGAVGEDVELGGVLVEFYSDCDCC